MKDFRKLLQEIKSIANNITKEEFEQAIKEYDEIYNKRDYNLVLSSENDEDYILTNPYFYIDTVDGFAQDTYKEVG